MFHRHTRETDTRWLRTMRGCGRDEGVLRADGWVVAPGASANRAPRTTEHRSGRRSSSTRRSRHSLATQTLVTRHRRSPLKRRPRSGTAATFTRFCSDMKGS
eukprot:6196457-Pleurochrysis_carterae.AAC.1